MATLTIRRVDEALKARLRIRAAQNGRSMEEEVREILRAQVDASQPAKLDLAKAIRKRFEPLGGMELRLPRREPVRDPRFPAK